MSTSILVLMLHMLLLAPPTRIRMHHDAGTGSIVLMSVVDIVATIVAAGGANLSFLRILRMLRVLRMLRLMKSWKGLYKICMTFIKSIPQMANLFVLMFLVMVIFSLLGMQLFGGCFNPSTAPSTASNPNPTPTLPLPLPLPLPLLLTLPLTLTRCAEQERDEPMARDAQP